MNSPDTPARDEPIARSQHDWTTIRPSVAVVETVAEATDRAPTAFGPLNAAVDPDALDALLRRGESTADGPVVSFVLDELRVTVYGRGAVVVRAQSG